MSKPELFEIADAEMRASEQAEWARDTTPISFEQCGMACRFAWFAFIALLFCAGVAWMFK